MTSSSAKSELTELFPPSNHLLNETLLSGYILLTEEIPRRTYKAPTIAEGPINITRKPSNMKQIPNEPKEIVDKKMPGLLRRRSKTAPVIDTGNKTIPNIIGKMKNIDLSYGKLRITRS